jgi:hypothetical protein
VTLDGLPGEAQVRAADSVAGRRLRRGLAGFDGVRSCGGVRVSPAAITANASTTTVNFAGLAVKRAPTSEMLKMMLANGSVVTAAAGTCSEA